MTDHLPVHSQKIKKGWGTVRSLDVEVERSEGEKYKGRANVPNLILHKGASHSLPYIRSLYGSLAYVYSESPFVANRWLNSKKKWIRLTYLVEYALFSKQLLSITRRFEIGDS